MPKLCNSVSIRGDDDVVVDDRDSPDRRLESIPKDPRRGRRSASAVLLSAAVVVAASNAGLAAFFIF